MRQEKTPPKSYKQISTYRGVFEQVYDFYIPIKEPWGSEFYLNSISVNFYGMSETAIQNQIYLALIAYCLNVLIQLEMKSKKSLLRISRWLKAALWKPAYVWIRRFDRRTST
jgi:hypothetical protein